MQFLRCFPRTVDDGAAPEAVDRRLVARAVKVYAGRSAEKFSEGVVSMFGGSTPGSPGLGPDPSAHPWTFVAKESLDRQAEVMGHIGYRHPQQQNYYLVYQMGDIELTDPFMRHWSYSIHRLRLNEWQTLQDDKGMPHPVQVCRVSPTQVAVKWIPIGG
jgi:hypothetical protein